MARNQIKKISPAKFFRPLWPWCFIVFDLSGLFLRKIWFLRLKKACIKKSAGFNFLFFSKLQSNVYYALRKFKNIYMSVYCSMHMWAYKTIVYSTMYYYQLMHSRKHLWPKNGALHFWHWNTLPPQIDLIKMSAWAFYSIK